ncbi:MAG: c-type cytochrome [SAR324 cluster bacterium]|nr:c-type cytochrome [SAR324 cluster bacterium]
MKRLVLTGATLLLAACTAFAAGDSNRGAVLYENCATCHGDNAGGMYLSNAPALAGQYDWYLEAQLKNFQSGVRGTHAGDVQGQMMKPFSLTLVDEKAVADVVAYIGTLKAEPQAAKLAGDAGAGKSAYGTCAACHGANGEGNPALKAPRLSGLPDWYIAGQLHSFKQGFRGSRSDDANGLTMRPMTLALDDAAINNLATYISGFSRDASAAGTAAAASSSTSGTATSTTASGLLVAKVSGEHVPYSNPLEADNALYATCASCHGNEGEGNAKLNAPRLAGQEDWYLSRQLQNWKDGIRGAHPEDVFGMQMRPMAASLQSGQIQKLATHIAGLAGDYPEATLDGDVKAGAAAFNTCVACHGANGEGNPALNAPKLQGLPDWYVARQLQAFKAGIRGQNPRDQYGQQMRPMAAGLSDEAVIDVSSFIATLRPGIEPLKVAAAASPSTSGGGGSAAGKAAYGTCLACHGANGEGNQALNAPRLAGQQSWYMERQLHNFRKGIRGTHADDAFGKTMAPMAAGLANDQAVSDVSAYAATLSGAKSAATLGGDATAGQAAYATCVACHGANGEGNQALNAPKLGGLQDWYVARQLKNFKNGVRGSHAEDTFGKTMAPMALTLDDAAVNNVSAYIATLPE